MLTLTMEYEHELPIQEAAFAPMAMTGLSEVATTADVTAIHTTNLLGALHVYAKLVRLKSSDEIAPRAVITAGDLRLIVEGGHVSVDAEDTRLRLDERCVRFTTPSVREAFATLKRAGARMIDTMQVLSPDCAMFSLAGRDGAVIEFIGRP
jgi:hypothetical protein